MANEAQGVSLAGRRDEFHVCNRCWESRCVADRLRIKMQTMPAESGGTGLPAIAELIRSLLEAAVREYEQRSLNDERGDN